MMPTSLRFGGFVFVVTRAQARQRSRRLSVRKFQLHAPAIHLPARAHPLHNFLAGVAALAETDVRRLQAQPRAESPCR